MRGQWRARLAVMMAMTCTAGRAAAEPVATGPGVVDDHVVKAAMICASKELETVDVQLTDDGKLWSKGTVRGWCLAGDFAKLGDNTDVLLAALAICRGNVASKDLSERDRDLARAACAGTRLSRADALRLGGMARSTSGARTVDAGLLGLGGPGPETAAGALTTTTDIVARAVASFLEKRATAEFKEFILRRLRKKVCDDLKLQPWVPNTCAYLGSAEDDTTLPLSLGTGLRSALLQDAAELPDHVIANLLTPAADGTGTAALLLTRAGFEIALSLVRHRDPSYAAAVFEQLANDPRFCSATDVDCANVKLLFAVVGRALAVIRAGQLGTAGAIDFATAARFLGAELQKNTALKPILVDLAALIPADADGKLHRLLAAAAALSSATRKLEAAIGEAIDDKPDGEKAHFRDVANQAAAVISQLDVLAEAASELIARPDVLAKLAALRDQLTYARSLVTALAQADLAKGVTLILTRISATKIGAKIPGAVSRVLSFAIDLATAKDAEAVIEGIAAPVGAWQGKLEDTVFSISGFVGGALGYESTRVDGADVKSRSVGPIAALGFDINVPGKLGGFFHDGLRPGLFLSVIDVGALMSYGYDTPSQNTNDKSLQAGQTTPIGFAQIFAPGAFVRLGISRTPLVIGGGVSFLPRGRSITTTDSAMTTSEERSAVRWSLFLAVDVTILPF